MSLKTAPAAASAALKKFAITDLSGEFGITLEVDTEKLTPELATEINEFWGGADDRLQAEDGDVVRAVIRLYGARMMGLMLAVGGVTVDDRIETSGPSIWTKEMHAEEGWPGADGTPHGVLGIRVVEANVEAPGFDYVSLQDA